MRSSSSRITSSGVRVEPTQDIPLEASNGARTLQPPRLYLRTSSFSESFIVAARVRWRNGPLPRAFRRLPVLPRGLVDDLLLHSGCDEKRLTKARCFSNGTSWKVINNRSTWEPVNHKSGVGKRIFCGIPNGAWVRAQIRHPPLFFFLTSTPSMKHRESLRVRTAPREPHAWETFFSVPLREIFTGSKVAAEQIFLD